MRFKRTIVIGATASLLVPVATAQSRSPQSEGARVRITAPSVGTRPLVGTLVGIESDALKLDVEGALESRVVPRSAVTKLEFSQGRKRNTMKGAWIGLATGAVAGGALAAAYASSDGGPVNAEFVPLVAGVYGAAGMALGALIGAMVKSERWREADLEGPLVSVGSVPGGGVGFSIHVPVGRSR
jgi:hypothetical protein